MYTIQAASEQAKETKSPFFVSHIGGGYDIIEYFDSYFENWDVNFNYGMYFVIQPDQAGKIVTFKTDELYTFGDILSKFGGLYSLVAAILFPCFLHIIWGFETKKIKFSGLDKDADVGGIEEKKLKSFMRKYIKHYVAKEMKDVKDIKKE